MTQVPVYRRQPDRRLTIQAETFRDHLLPGSKENWKFRITDADSSTVSAEVLASMYDASLDKLLPFKWSFSPKRDIYLYAPRFSEGTAFTNSSRYESGERKGLTIPQYQYDRLDWQDVLSLGYRYGRSNQVYATGAVMKSAAAPAIAESLSITDNSAPLEESAIRTEQGVAVITAEEEVEGSPLFCRVLQEPVELRENFAETAFFYPALVTDEAGDVAFSFTMPESNTTWKLQLLAQTEDLKYGYLSREIITNKPLMVTPNLPRFLRQGDEVTLTAQVSNQSSATIDGRASLELFDPYNDQSVICLTKSQKPFTLGADSTTTVSWSFKVPSSTAGVIGCRIMADSNKGSDGEQHLIPVLSNEILVTESTPFYLFDKSEEVIRLKNGQRSQTVPHDTGTDRQPHLVRRTGIADPHPAGKRQHHFLVCLLLQQHAGKLHRHRPPAHPAGYQPMESTGRKRFYALFQLRKERRAEKHPSTGNTLGIGGRQRDGTKTTPVSPVRYEPGSRTAGDRPPPPSRPAKA